MLFLIMLVLAMLAVTGLAVREVMLFAHTRAVYGLRRLTLRMSTAILLLFLLGSILLGVRFFHLATPEECGFPSLWAAFWGCIGFITGGVFCLLIADMHLVADENLNEVGRIWHDVAETIAAHQAERERKDQ